MLNILPESRRVRRRASTSAVISAAVHVGIIAAAAYATAAPPPRPRPVVPDTVVHFQPSRPTTPKPLDRASPTLRRTAIEDPPVPPITPPVTSTVATDVPTELPPIDATLGDVFARDSTRVTVVGSHARPPSGDTGGAILANEYAHKPALALETNPSPRYPEMLRVAGVTGSVTMRFVIDTTGRVIMRTAEARHSDHELFTAAVLAALPRMRYLPAEVTGRKVRVLVQQRFEFRLER